MLYIYIVKTSKQITFNANSTKVEQIIEIIKHELQIPPDIDVELHSDCHGYIQREKETEEGKVAANFIQNYSNVLVTVPGPIFALRPPLYLKDILYSLPKESRQAATKDLLDAMPDFFIETFFAGLVARCSSDKFTADHDIINNQISTCLKIFESHNSNSTTPDANYSKLNPKDLELESQDIPSITITSLSAAVISMIADYFTYSDVVSLILCNKYMYCSISQFNIRKTRRSVNMERFMSAYSHCKGVVGHPMVRALNIISTLSKAPTITISFPTFNALFGQFWFSNSPEWHHVYFQKAITDTFEDLHELTIRNAYFNALTEFSILDEICHCWNPRSLTLINPELDHHNFKSLYNWLAGFSETLTNIEICGMRSLNWADDQYILQAPTMDYQLKPFEHSKSVSLQDVPPIVIIQFLQYYAYHKYNKLKNLCINPEYDRPLYIDEINLVLQEFKIYNSPMLNTVEQLAVGNIDADIFQLFMMKTKIKHLRKLTYYSQDCHEILQVVKFLGDRQTNLFNELDYLRISGNSLTTTLSLFAEIKKFISTVSTTSSFLLEIDGHTYLNDIDAFFNNIKSNINELAAAFDRFEEWVIFFHIHWSPPISKCHKYFPFYNCADTTNKYVVYDDGGCKINPYRKEKIDGFSFASISTTKMTSRFDIASHRPEIQLHRC